MGNTHLWEKDHSFIWTCSDRGLGSENSTSGGPGETTHERGTAYHSDRGKCRSSPATDSTSASISLRTHRYFCKPNSSNSDRETVPVITTYWFKASRSDTASTWESNFYLPKPEGAQILPSQSRSVLRENKDHTIQISEYEVRLVWWSDHLREGLS